MSELREHSRSVLLRPIPELGLSAGDVGVVIHRHRDKAGMIAGYLLELFSIDGVSLDEVSVPADAVRPALPTDRAAARPVAAE
jgi:hypothetical protein